ncbi:MAG: type II toxin-antitoxin system VapC family toxin [Rhodanobacter sp.]|jgi:predicted nucleic acid-binding protein|nr:type II toxin-antitoxin system VapC family toxin [Rhodanobacter sp.]
MYLLDTNVICELRLGRRADARVRDWVRAQPQAALYISAITLLEIEQGILLKARRDAQQGERLRTWFRHQVIPSFERRTLAVDASVALTAAQLHVPNPAPERDALIAATALVHGFAVVTRNIGDFEGVSGLPRVNPWQGTRDR